MPASKQEALPRARRLYAQGQSADEIAESLGVSASTIYRWMAADSKAGRDWDAQQQISDFSDLRDVIGALVVRLRVHVEDTAMPPGKWADITIKLINSLEKTLDLFGDNLQKMIAMDWFSAWFEARYTGEELRILRGAVNGCMAEMKEDSP